VFRLVEGRSSGKVHGLRLFLFSPFFMQDVPPLSVVRPEANNPLRRVLGRGTAFGTSPSPVRLHGTRRRHFVPFARRIPTAFSTAWFHGEVSRLIFELLSEFFSLAAQRQLLCGCVASYQSFGEFARFHPHWHVQVLATPRAAYAWWFRRVGSIRLSALGLRRWFVEALAGIHSDPVWAEPKGSAKHKAHRAGPSCDDPVVGPFRI